MTSVPAFVGCVVVLLGLVPSASLAERACPTVKNVDPSALRGDAAKDDWRVHRNAKSGLGFRYPPSMRVEERDPATFGLDEVPDAIVDLRGDGEHARDFIVLRFICRPGRRTAAMAAARARELRKGRSRGGKSPGATMTVDGHEAIIGYGCGSAACLWSVLTLQPRECAPRLVRCCSLGRELVLAR